MILFGILIVAGTIQDAKNQKNWYVMLAYKEQFSDAKGDSNRGTTHVSKISCVAARKHGYVRFCEHMWESE